jgi:tetratricopeptide (TPR) repeat protein
MVCREKQWGSCRLGVEDSKFAPEEIIDYCLESGESCRPLIEAELGRPLPWLLNDADPTTLFDAEVRNKIDECIQYLQKLLGKKALSQDSTAYQERLAVGLYALVALPSAAKIAAAPELFQRATRELDELGLGEFKAFLAGRGGLRTDADFSNERSALESLRVGLGKCTETSKTLYAVLKRAKLQPCFAFVNLWKTRHPDVRTFLKQNPFYAHVCVGLELAGKPRLLDASLLESQAPHDDYRWMSTREFLSAESSNRGSIALQKGRFDLALKELQTALWLDPNFNYAYLNLGMIRLLQSDVEEALRCFHKVLEFEPQSVAAYFGLGLAWRVKQDNDQAQKAFRKAVELNPEFAPAYCGLGDLWATAGDWKQAEENYSRAVEVNERYEEALFKLAIARSMQERWRESVESYNRLLTVLGESGKKPPPELLFNRGGAFLSLGTWDAALADMNTVLAERPRFGPAYLQRAVIHFKREDFPKARADLVIFLQFAPPLEAEQMKQMTLAWEPAFGGDWKSPKRTGLRVRLEEETGVDLINAESRMAVAAMLWEGHHFQEAVECQKPLIDVLQKRRVELAEKKKKFSPRAKKFLKELFQRLPGDMRENKEVQELWKGLN